MKLTEQQEQKLADALLGATRDSYKNMALAVVRAYDEMLKTPRGRLTIPPDPPKPSRQPKRAGKLAACIAAMFMAATAEAAPICDLRCLSPGNSNQALCSQNEPYIMADWYAGALTVGYTANNGTFISDIWTDAITWAGTVWSNGDSVTIAHPTAPTQIYVRVEGVGGPGRSAMYGCQNCGDVPEGSTYALVAMGLLGVAVARRRTV